MKKTLFKVPKMDCPSEERMIRMAFDGVQEVQKLEFDLPQRHLEIFHLNNSNDIMAILLPLGFGGELIHSEEIIPVSSVNKTLFKVPKMDCPSEERTFRMAFEGNDNVQKLEFNLTQRQLEIFHRNTAEEVLNVLSPLGFGAEIMRTEKAQDFICNDSKESDDQETAALKSVFAINALMFVVVLIAGLIADSTGLLADSIDNLADASVFGLSLYAVGKSRELKRKAAKMSGVVQLILALGTSFEVLRRIIFGSEPESQIMMIVAALALIANLTSMYLMSSHRKGEIHLQASWIFLSNDVIANIGVIIAGVLVHYFKSELPDLIIAIIISCVVMSGAIRILRSTKKITS